MVGMSHVAARSMLTRSVIPVEINLCVTLRPSRKKIAEDLAAVDQQSQ